MTSSTSPASHYFRPALFAFLRDLAANNRREWFVANKERYESTVRDPALRFISDFGPRLRKISRHFNADPRPVGGSFFRIYRDVRFSRDKRPYKTHAGIQFRHVRAKSVHAPGFYLHLEPGASFAGLGVWHPDGPTLRRIRDAIVEDPAAWKRAKGAKTFRSTYELSGDSLKKPPRGYDAEHPLIEDLKRKDIVAVTKLTQKQITGSGFLDEYTELSRAGAPLMRFLCRAVGVEF